MIIAFLKNNRVTLTIALLCVTTFTTMWIIEGGTTGVILLLNWGGNFNAYTFDDQPWRLLTSMFLHAGLIHIILNMYSLIFIGSVLERKIGSFWFLLLYLVSGLFASLASGYWNVFFNSVGASGAIFGLYGFQVAYLIFENNRDSKIVVSTTINFTIYLVVILIVGSFTNFDNAAHVGGLLAGFAMFLTYFISKRLKHQAAPAIAIILIVFSLTYSYFAISRAQVEYTRSFQTLLELDRRTMAGVGGSQLSDFDIAINLEELQSEWDSLFYQLDEQPFINQAVDQDIATITYYGSLRKEQMRLMNRLIGEGSYIYNDSLEIIVEEFKKTPQLNYILNFENTVTLLATNQQEVLTLRRYYYDSLWREATPADFSFYRIGYQDSLGRWSGKIKDYYKERVIQMKGEYKGGLRHGVFLYYTEDGHYSSAGRYENDISVGKWQYFYENGQLDSEILFDDRAYLLDSWDETGKPLVVKGNGIHINLYKNGIVKLSQNYIDGIREGESIGYHKDGSFYFREKFENGYLVYGKSYEKGREHEYDFGSYSPRPTVGYEKMYQYIKENIQYPEEAKRKGIYGDLKMAFMVYKDGSVGDFKFLKHFGGGCEEEAIRLVTEGPEWVPATLHGVEPIASRGNLWIRFSSD